MEFKNIIRLTRWKTVISLLPFAFPLNQIFGELETKFLFLPTELGILLEIPLTVIFLIETYIASPFEFLLKPIGWWSNNAPVLFPDGPLLPGSFAVAVTYSMLIYFVWSLASRRTQK